ncbi:MBL fold metallo-hydrolase [Oceanibacterium hippocampi]|uniref:Hydroxyacylglutathione hydrolase n=1 Tax=Oceanibacterium hippocampi TaxID=745714 RepID=A0A1Y5TUC7_9PROT|nr:MBL fold metallo-hydrolase [Oceanibacterium hippocampi]SLN72790.1 Hydroxyacylglutathione hydrolase [Oceanibacterium hippocampi]
MTQDLVFNRELEFDYATAETVSPLIRRVIARNPGPFTFHGTGTYIIGHGKVAIVDPGPDIAEHVDALLHALRGEDISHILVTHTHRDHSPAAAAVAAATGAPTYGFGPHAAGRSDVKIEEGGDTDFRPVHTTGDGDVIAGAGWTVEAVHTPGHLSNHLCFALREEAALFSGDHVMGWSTSIVSPPDGDMADYMASLEKLLPREEHRYYPTHGAPIDDPRHHVAGLIRHRKGREAQILARLKEGPQTIMDMVRVNYRDTPAILHPAAARSMLAHLIDMTERGLVLAERPESGRASETATYRLP